MVTIDILYELRNTLSNGTITDTIREVLPDFLEVMAPNTGVK